MRKKPNLANILSVQHIFFSLEAEKDDDNRMDIMFDRLMLMELRENVSKIDSKSFAELRSYNEPPKIVQNIVKAVVAIFHLEQVESGELDDWTNLRNVSCWSCQHLMMF